MTPNRVASSAGLDGVVDCVAKKRHTPVDEASADNMLVDNLRETVQPVELVHGRIAVPFHLFAKHRPLGGAV